MAQMMRQDMLADSQAEIKMHNRLLLLENDKEQDLNWREEENFSIVTN